MSPSINAPLVTVIGEPDKLDHIRSALQYWNVKLECCETGDLLKPYDRETLDGEERLTEMEAIYSSLRGRILVRLLVVDLNPEAVENIGHCPIGKALDDWMEIDRRRSELLREQHQERMTFATVLVIERGELGDSHRQALLQLAGLADGPASSYGVGQRVYLMTRLLELGQSKVLHAKDVWPQFVGGLLCHFAWAASQEQQHPHERIFSDSGIFGWRTCRIVASVDEKALEAKTKSVLDSVGARLLKKEDSNALFAPLHFSTDVSAPPFNPAVENSYERLAWNELRAVEALGRMEHSPAWRTKSSDYAQSVRASILTLAREHELDTSLGKSLLRDAKQSPARLFPEKLHDAMPDFVAGAREGIEKIQNKRAEAKKAFARLSDWSEDHDLAANAFVSIKECMLIGLTVSAMLCYSLVAICWVVAQFVPHLSPEIWWLGATLIVAALGGVTFGLLANYLLQRQRGVRARRQLRSQADAWSRLVSESSEETARWMLQSFGFRKYLVLAIKRSLMRHRLWRVEQVLKNELQGAGGSRHPMPQVLQAERDIHKHLEYAIKSRTESKYSEEEIQHLINAETTKFLMKWSKYLENDRLGYLFLPVAPVLQICRDQVARIFTEVRDKLVEGVVGAMRDNQTLRDEVRRELLAADLFGNSGNLFSVDFVEGTTHETVYHRQHLQEIFSHHSVEVDVPVDKDELGPGVLAMWFGECQLEFAGTDEQGRMRFISHARRSAQ